MEKRFISIKELAEYLDIKIGTAYSWVYQKKINYFKMGRLVKFDKTKLDEWIRRHEVKGYL
jgi:excisionase family DNA binding protein